MTTLPRERPRNPGPEGLRAEHADQRETALAEVLAEQSHGRAGVALKLAIAACLLLALVLAFPLGRLIGRLVPPPF